MRKTLKSVWEKGKTVFRNDQWVGCEGVIYALVPPKQAITHSPASTLVLGSVLPSELP